MLNDVECQLDQPNTVKNVSLYLTAPGSNPGARILKIMFPQLCGLCISDTYPASNSASLLAWRSAAMKIAHFGHPSRKAAGEARTENMLHRLRHRIVDIKRDT